MSEGNVRFQREFYDRHFARRAAAVEEQLAHPLFRSFNDRVARHAFDLANLGGGGRARVLEVGCGEGLLADAIRRTAEERKLALTYTGLDVSDSALELARSHVEGTLLCGDATEVVAQLPADSQDLVIAKNLLHHLDDPATFLREAGRVVGPDGRLVIFEPNLGCPQFLLFNVLAFRREPGFICAVNVGDAPAEAEHAAVPTGTGTSAHPRVRNRRTRAAPPCPRNA